MTEHELDELVARVNATYTRFGLSPPSRLRDAARRWLGLDHGEILDIVEGHLRDRRRFYVTGSGDQLFSLVEQAIRKAWQDKHPPRDHVEDEPAPPRRRRGVRQVYQAGGYPDAIDEREDEGADA